MNPKDRFIICCHLFCDLQSIAALGQYFVRFQSPLKLRPLTSLAPTVYLSSVMHLGHFSVSGFHVYSHLHFLRGIQLSQSLVQTFKNITFICSPTHRPFMWVLVPNCKPSVAALFIEQQIGSTVRCNCREWKLKCNFNFDTKFSWIVNQKVASHYVRVNNVAIMVRTCMFGYEMCANTTRRLEWKFITKLMCRGSKWWTSCQIQHN